uniref:Uncharacterized protein n=1 Tax=Salmonella phage PMBT35 TaxID=3137287 RepID=A0AAU8BWA6_9VIRU
MKIKDLFIYSIVFVSFCSLCSLMIWIVGMVSDGLCMVICQNRCLYFLVIRCVNI